jgi:hypothetical protein
MARQRKSRKITFHVPAENEGLTETVRNTLELRTNENAWRKVARWPGKVKWSISLEELRED